MCYSPEEIRNLAIVSGQCETFPPEGYDPVVRWSPFDNGLTSRLLRDKGGRGRRERSQEEGAPRLSEAEPLETRRPLCLA